MRASRVVLPVAELDAARRIARFVILSAAAIYVVAVWFDGVGLRQPLKRVPPSLLFFVEVAALFTGAQKSVTEYRAEGWSCANGEWVELDVRPWFPMNAEIKENRFHRALKFHHKDRRVLRALEDFIVARHNAARPEGAGPAERTKIGGVRLDRIHVPFPALGEHVDPFVHKPLADHPEKTRRALFTTPAARRNARCASSASAPAAAEDEAASPASDEASEEP